MMQHAERLGVPFWPAPSILDTPLVVLHWNAIRAEAEAQAEEERARHNHPRSA